MNMKRMQLGSGRISWLLPFVLLAAILALAAMFLTSGGSGPTLAGAPGMRAVYTMTNDASGNKVIVFDRAENGTLHEAGRFATGGKGTGVLVTGSQDGIELTDDGRFLLVVNPGSNQVSVFAVGASGLQRTDVVDAGGKKPVSVSVHEKLVYVLTVDDGTGSIHGFTLDSAGRLTPIPNSARRVSDDALALPSQVEFSPDGRVLVVSARYTGPEHAGRLFTYTVDLDGVPGMPQPQPSSGRTPFAFMFTPHGQLVVSESFETAPGRPIPDQGKTSSYRVSAGGQLQVISASVPSKATATCWVQVSKDGRFAYVTNTASKNITRYSIGADGGLTMLGHAPTGTGPLDMAVSADGNYLYAINGVDGSISAFRVNSADGSLTLIQTVNFAPNSAFGLAAR